jgi:autotransporter-associated beta strand protein
MKKSLVSFLTLWLAFSSSHGAQSAWVHYNANHFLVYSNDNLGNHLPDFSYAGYAGGGVAIPTNQVVRTNLNAQVGDNTAYIQNAINYVSGLTPDANGSRGVVLLNPGTYQIAGTLAVNAGGVILRGSGNNTNTGTVLLVTGNARTVLSVSGSGSWTQTGGTYTIGDTYVPLGATNFHVSTSGVLWGTNVTVSADADVFTNGTLLYAYDWDGVNATVNGIAFTGTSTTSGGANVSLSGIGDNYTGYSSASPPFSTLSNAYQSILAGGEYNSGAATATVTLNNLTIGRVYAVQMWVDDSRGGSVAGRTETVTGSNVVTLADNVPAATGGVGQYTIGVFTAGATSQTFSLLGSASTQLNALLVSDVTTTGYQPVNPPAQSAASAFAVGETIVVQRPWTQAWINAIAMSNYWSPGDSLKFERQVVAVSGNQVTVDAPLCNPIESQWTTGLAYQVTDPGRIQQCGLENLCAVGQIADYPSNILTGVFADFSNLKNCWARNLLLSGWGNAINLDGGSKWCTVQDCQYTNPATGTASAAPAAWTVAGAQDLFQRCSSYGGHFWVMVSQDSTPGPDVFLNMTSGGISDNASPHQRWAAGVLFDSINTAPDTTGGSTPYLGIINRGGAGTGQGWGAGFSLIYNCQVPQFQLEQPNVPNHYNWVIGGIGSKDSYSDNGIYDALGAILNPQSLYLEQLRERLGGAAVENIGYQLFTLSTSPASQAVLVGGSTAYTVNVGDPAAMGNVVALAVGGLPANANAVFSTNSVVGAGAATLLVTASNSVAPGTYTLSITGTNSGVSLTNLVSLTIGNFGLSASPATQTVIVGSSNGSYTVAVATNSAFSGTVSFGVGGLPAGTSAGFSPGSLPGAGNSTLTVSVTGTAPAGNYTLTISGTNGPVVASTTVSLVIVATPVWTGGSPGDNNWNDAANWGGIALAPGAPLIFDGNVRLNNTNNTAAGTVYSNLVFNPGAGVFVLNGNSITLGGGLTNNSANVQTVDLGLNFNTSLTLNGGGGLILGGELTNTLGAPGYTTLTLAGTGTLTNLLSSPSSPGGTNNLTMITGTANWTLADNSLSTPMTVPWAFNIQSGTFNFGTAGSLPVLTSITPRSLPQDNQVGVQTGSVGTLNIVNGTLTLVARLDTATANTSTGIVNQVGGTLNLDDQFQGANGSNLGEVSIVNISGGTMNIGTGASPGGPFYLASRGNGTLNLTSGTLNCGTLDISRNADGGSFGSVGVVNLNGGTIVASKVATATANGQNGGNPSATFNFNGGTLKINSSTPPFFHGSTVAPLIPITAVVRSGGVYIDSNGNTNLFAEPLLHDSGLGSLPDGGLTKNGAGCLILVSNVSYTGNTTVNAGTLALSNAVALGSSPVLTVAPGATLDASGRSDGTLTLNNGQTLGGSGVLNGNVVVGGGATLFPGNPLGTLTCNDNLTLNGGSTTEMGLNPSLSTNEVVSVAGALTYGGTLVLTNLGGPFSNGNSFKLFNAAGGFNGGFTNIVPVIPAVNLGWNTNGLTNGVLGVVALPTASPRFGSVNFSSNGLVLGGTNGVSNWTYYVLASTNLGASVSSWTRLATNAFNANGGFLFTNPFPATASPNFYLLQLQ